MTDATNGWPGKPGVPLNPEKDGWHWIYNEVDQELALWNAKTCCWQMIGNDELIEPGELAEWGWCYLGPVLPNDEVQNLRDDLASAERERAHQHGRADRNAAEHAREQGKREALQARVAELEKALKINFHKHVQGASAADVVITRILPHSVSGVELKRMTEGKKDE